MAHDEHERRSDDGARRNVPSAVDRCMRGKGPVIREDGAIEIPLTKGQVAVVDADSYHLVCDKLWRAMWSASTESYYALHNYWVRVGMRKLCRSLRMHSVVARTDARRVDHRDHDTLNNRLSNLRPATVAENNRNRTQSVGKSSIYKGVSKHSCGKWQANIKADGKSHYLGIFDAEADAADAYDRAATKLHADFALLNAR